MNNTHTVTPADMSAPMQKSYGWWCSLWILSIFSYDNFAGWPTGQHGMSVHGVG